MADIIQLLPDTVANQIAAGEVIQRPASAVKELLENSIDAGSTSVKLIVKDAGKTLIQVIDNGRGMSATDARMCFERHATSKIQKADDLFRIRTKGFRGEALASVAAIAQVELKTRKTGEETGTLIEIEGNLLKRQEACACSEGTSFSVKNLFFNVPARRNFLKSDTIELRHIIEEFQRVALAHPEVAFVFHHNNSEVYNLECNNLRQRIVAMYSKSYNERIAPVEESTDIVKVTGFIGKPEYARKTRGEQFFFVNSRFIKSPYLHHAVQSAFEQLLPADSFPSYFLYLEVNPETIDINIHPTKTEIKFEEERFIYTILRAAIKKSLGQYNITPSLDFEQEMSLRHVPHKPDKPVSPPGIRINPDYNPFEKSPREASNNFNWQALYENLRSEQAVSPEAPLQTSFPGEEEEKSRATPFQLQRKYIVTSIKTGLLIINQQGAHERILYEKYLRALEKQPASSQQLMFPENIELGAEDRVLVTELMNDIQALGFIIEPFGKNDIIIRGIPTELTDMHSIRGAFEKMLEHYKQNMSELRLEKRESLARSLAKTGSIKEGKELSGEEMNRLIDQLFACRTPWHTPAGKPSAIIQSLEELDGIME